MKVDIYTMNGGNGTLAPSCALASYLNTCGCQARVIDIMAEVNPLGEILANVYNYLLRRSIFFAALYMEFAHAFPIDHFAPYNSIGKPRIARMIGRDRPHAIIMICPWISRMVVQAVLEAGRRGNARPLLMVNVVDIGDGMTTSWINNDVDFTNLPTHNAERFLSAYDLDTKKTRVLGVPLHEDFSPGPVTAEERSRARSVYGIDDANQVVSIIGGREGVKNTSRILKALMAAVPNIEYMVHCGMNQRLLTKIRAITERQPNIHPLGFVDSMRELYALSDVVITKPGAITVSELVVSRVPFILDTWPIVMPQEKGNVRFVLENGFGIAARNIPEIAKHVTTILSGDTQLQKGSPNRDIVRKNLFGTEKVGDWIIDWLNTQAACE